MTYSPILSQNGLHDVSKTPKIVSKTAPDVFKKHLGASKTLTIASKTLLQGLQKLPGRRTTPKKHIQVMLERAQKLYFSFVHGLPDVSKTPQVDSESLPRLPIASQRHVQTYLRCPRLPPKPPKTLPRSFHASRTLSKKIPFRRL